MIGPTETPAARLDPWCLVDIDGNKHLFGYAVVHNLTGGKSWTRSSPIVEIDEEAGLCRTASGRLYGLGRRIMAKDLEDEEALLALEMLIERPRKGDRLEMGKSVRASCFLTARKIARHLGIETPVTLDGDHAAFIEQHQADYRRKLAQVIG